MTDPKTKKKPFDLVLMGWGTRGIGQLTFEQAAYLAKARHVALSPGSSDALRAYLGTRSCEVHDLGSAFYKEGVVRAKALGQISNYVVDLAKKKGGTVFMQYGHPMVYSRPTELVVAKARRAGLKVVVLPGISSIDELLCYLNIDIKNRDLQLMHGRLVYEMKRPINPHADLMLIAAGYLGEARIALDPSLRAKRSTIPEYERLRRHLERYYPPTHVVRALYLVDGASPGCEEIRFPIRRLPEIAPKLHYGHTLYLKALSER